VISPFAFVLRFAGFRLSKSDLELRLKAAVERYSLDKGGYAQLTIDKDGLDWEVIDAFLQEHGPAVRRLRDGGDVQSVSVDLAFDVPEGVVVASRTVPARTAVLAGSHGIDVMFSAYLSTP
jgi:hypothetical protein